MKASRWLDHLPPWLAWGSIASTGAYGPGELACMALPLLAAALAEWRGWFLGRCQRGLEIAALAALLFMVGLRIGLLPTVVNMLFILCAVRLALPRALAQRRQIVLMGFLLFITTAITSSELDFLLWSVAWMVAAATLFMRLNWEKSARLRPGSLPPPPQRPVLGWSAGALVLAAGFFVILPRLHAGLQSLPLGARRQDGPQAGLSDTLDLGGKGPIALDRTVALRIRPAGTDPDQLQQDLHGLRLLRGFVLEELDGQRWRVSTLTPHRPWTRWDAPPAAPRPLAADFFLEPTLLGTIPLPYGQADLAPPALDALRFSRGGSLRWAFPVPQVAQLRVALAPSGLLPEPPPRGTRLALLTATGTGTFSARDWGLRAAPGDRSPRDLAERLSGSLRATFRYTLDNPSGQAANPLQDFLEHSRAGHCEYFAAALALMLRYRGVPARVASGFRLGSWIPEGGYFLVTQAEAHSWVEYYDAGSGGWRVADPTPALPFSPFGSASFLASIARWTDTLRFTWDRDVVRFSDDDQMAGLGWAMDEMRALDRLPRRGWARFLAGLAGLGALLWFRPRRPIRWFSRWAARTEPEPIRELRPLVRKASRTLPPRAGETARDWLDRLARCRPRRAAALAELAGVADAVAYGRGRSAALKALARAEARYW